MYVFSCIINKFWQTFTDLQAVGLAQKIVDYWAIQRSWFARVNAFCNLSRKKSREVAAHFRADF